jgi:UDP-GlcNAc:undecaprenyl-phosphate GlcNAc-1-phosphate transferase
LLVFEYVVSFGLAMLVSAGVLPALIRQAHRTGVVDRPGGRRSHSGEIPRLGGIAIFLGFVGGVGAALLLAGQAESLGQATSGFPWAGAGLGATIVFVAGLLDDVKQFRPRTKFLFQLVGAGVAVVFGVSIDALSLPIGGPFVLGAWSPLVTLGWILIVTNAMNLIDGLDGLAGGLALIVTTVMAFVSFALGHFGAAVCAVGLAGALIGFLRFNMNPARVFMGDGGSQFLGFMLAIISIRGSIKGAAAVALTMPLLVLAVPLLDLTTTVARRAWRSPVTGVRGLGALIRQIASADREHLHHNLVDLGLSPRRAVLALYLLASIFALAGYLSLARNSLALAGLLLVLCVGSVVLVKFALFGAFRSSPVSRPSEDP